MLFFKNVSLLISNEYGHTVRNVTEIFLSTINKLVWTITNSKIHISNT